jgi:hypothetical protein
VDNSISIQEIMNTTENHRAKGLGSKPMVVFLGEKWESDFSYQRIQNLLLGMEFLFYLHIIFFVDNLIV